MLKQILAFVLFSFFHVKAHSQRVSNNDVFLRYADSAKKETGFSIVELQENVSSEIVKKLKLNSQRILSENVFVIQNDAIKNRQDLEKMFKKVEPANNEWKLSPSLQELTSKGTDEIKLRFVLKFKDESSLQNFIKDHAEISTDIISNRGNILSLLSTLSYVEKKILNNNSVIAIDLNSRKAKEELAVTGFDLSSNQLNKVHAQFPNIKGEGQHVSIKENFYDTADIDLKGRLDASPLASAHITNHANFMATIIAGAGNSVFYALGAAPAAQISSSSFEVVLPDPATYYQQDHITVQNHSYGTGIDNIYGVNAVAFDENANQFDSLLHVFSSGNSGLDTSKEGAYKGVGGFANITGDFKMAKNILVVGASDSSGNPVPQSSAGPAYDGRILPHLVAFQINGTSESAALVSGTALLLQQFYKEKNKSVCASALVKAILINSADDVANPGPDYKTGFGNMNAMKAIECIDQNTVFTSSVVSGKTDSFQVTIPENCHSLKITLAWNDTAATAFAPKALVNDLDLKLINSSKNKTWEPWVLSSFPHPDSLNKIAERKRDSLNNQEQITLDEPSAGTYTIYVNGFNLLTEQQQYFIAYSFDTSSFNWQFPAGNNFAEKGTFTDVKWETTLTGIGALEYRFVSDSNWRKISDVGLQKKVFKWNVPDTIARVLLRMKMNENSFYSDTFLITKLLNPTTGFVCGDSLMIFWNKVDPITRYQIYRLGEKYMEPFETVNDTFAIISKNEIESSILAVSPVLPDGSNGIRSYGFNYNLQGAGCYINTFYVDLQNKSVELNLQLGTINNISKIEFEKLQGNEFKNIYSSSVNGFDYSFNYSPLKTGTSFFRAKLTLKSGLVIYSSVENLTYVEEGYLVTPIPVTRNSPVNIFTMTPDGEVITIIDVMGRITLQKEIQFTHEFIQTSRMQRGQYFYKITKKGKTASTGKLLVL